MKKLTVKQLVSRKRFTRKDVLYVMLEHWNYIAEFLTKENYNYTPYEIKEKTIKALELEDNELKSNCACCEYDERSKRYHCEDRCIIHWTNGSCDYGEWIDFYEYPTKEKALIIAYLAEETLDKLEGVVLK